MRNQALETIVKVIYDYDPYLILRIWKLARNILKICVSEVNIELLFAAINSRIFLISSSHVFVFLDYRTKYTTSTFSSTPTSGPMIKSKTKKTSGPMLRFVLFFNF